MEKRIAVIGGSGLVGGYLLREFAAGKQYREIIPTSYSVRREGFYPLDMTDSERLGSFYSGNPPDLVLFAAAMTHVDRCEEEKELCFRTNVEAVKNSIHLLKKLKKPFRFVFFSTEYVFDGARGPYHESDPVNPLSVYGESKRRAEELIQNEAEDYLIIRTTGVYGLERARRNFFYTVRHFLTEGKTIRVSSDQVSTPTYAGHIARTVRRLVERREKGIFHVVGNTRISRFDFAVRIARRFGWDPMWIEPVATAELGQKAKRPLNGGLLPSKIEGAPLAPTLQESMDEFYQEWKASEQTDPRINLTRN